MIKIKADNVIKQKNCGDLAPGETFKGKFKEACFFDSKKCENPIYMMIHPGKGGPYIIVNLMTGQGTPVGRDPYTQISDYQDVDVYLELCNIKEII